MILKRNRKKDIEIKIEGKFMITTAREPIICNEYARV